jgi:rSAM/selenodomain-associated transferase 1
MIAHQRKLIIFTRYPEPGKSKTRLIPVLGEKGASNLQRQMTQATLRMIEPLIQSDFLSLKIYFTGGNQDLMEDWLGKDFHYQNQWGEGLGDRMKFAFENEFRDRMTQVVIIGTDCPKLSENIIRQAFESLLESDLVLGPAQDGGYYLIGLKEVYAELLTEIAWGTHTVLTKTLEIAQNLELKTFLLPILQDIDRPEDLKEYIVNVKI